MRLLELLLFALVFSGLAFAQDQAPRRALPWERVSSGGLMLLDRKGELVRMPQPASPRKLTLDESLHAGLDPRVGPNVRLGDDPLALPLSMRAQAEPHLARHPLNPDFLVATFQEGRYAMNGGAVNCGYSISTNGGLSWSRELIPLLTTNTGGRFYRATDPVVGIDLSGNLYLNNLAALDTRFDASSLVISRSTNGGLSFEPPIEIAVSPETGGFVDKNWMAVNTFSNSPTAGRIVSTFTLFQSFDYPIGLTYSDDQGETWSALQHLTPVPSYTQGSQPVFLPSGKLAVVYWNFGFGNQGFERIEVVTSTDGGTSFQYSNTVALVDRYDAPEARDGTFLPSAAGNRTDDSLYVAYQGMHLAQPRILFTKSTDGGVTWSPPRPISDNPAGAAVFNPAIAVSSDGTYVSVIFYDGRVNLGNRFLVDIFLAQSFNGGASWETNTRLTAVSSDMRLAPLTTGGYMLGDYQGLVASEGPHVPSVGLFIDTRTGSPDPFIARVGASPVITFSSWRAARFSAAEILSGQAAAEGDFDSDGTGNALEYAFAMHPRQSDAPVLQFSRETEDSVGQAVAAYERLKSGADLSFQWQTSTNLLQWEPVLPAASLSTTGINLQIEQVRDRFELQATPRYFLRLTVTVD